MPKENDFFLKILLFPPILFPSFVIKDFLEILLSLGFVHGQMVFCLQTSEEIARRAGVVRAEGQSWARTSKQGVKAHQEHDSNYNSLPLILARRGRGCLGCPLPLALAVAPLPAAPSYFTLIPFSSPAGH